MIQRIQSIYLLLATICLVVTLFLPLMVFTNGFLNLTLFAQGIFDIDNNLIFPTWGVISIGGLSAFLSLVSIFLFKKRKGQMKMCYGAIACIIFFFVTLAVYANAVMTKLQLEFSNVGFSIALPIIAIIFLLLAVKGIKADEKLVRSLDRIR